MVSGTLYTYPGNYRAQKILIAAAYSDADVKVDPNFEFGKTNTCDAFLQKFPLGKVPAFEDTDGLCLSESNAIASYVSNDTLEGTNPIDRALIRQYVEFAENEILPSACTWVYPTLGFKQYMKTESDKATTHIKKCLALLNDLLSTRTYLVGERVSLADITLCCNMVMLYVQVLDTNFRKPFGNVNRWFTTCINQPNFKTVLGEIEFCTKMATFDSKRYQELHPKEKKAGKDPKAKQEKGKGKEEKKGGGDKPAPAAAAAAKPEKKVDPFADVPRCNMEMDAWKKMYCNNPKEVYRAWLWEHYDPNALSWWHADYKYNDECKVDFMTENMIGGFFQRCEGLRKNLFGNLLMIKEPGISHYLVSGVFLMRGTRLVFPLDDSWNYDAEHYNFRQLDPVGCEQDKNMIESYLDWEGDIFVGKEVEEGQTFK